MKNHLVWNIWYDASTSGPLLIFFNYVSGAKMFIYALIGKTLKNLLVLEP